MNYQMDAPHLALRMTEAGKGPHCRLADRILHQLCRPRGQQHIGPHSSPKL